MYDCLSFEISFRKNQHAHFLKLKKSRDSILEIEIILAHKLPSSF